MASEEERCRVIEGSQQKFKETLNEATLQEPEYMTMATFSNNPDNVYTIAGKDILHKKSKNDCNSTVTGGQQGITKKEGSNRKCVIILFVIVFALFLSTAGACVAFILELFNLQNELQQLNKFTQLLFSDLEQVSGQYPFYPTTSCAALLRVCTVT